MDLYFHSSCSHPRVSQEEVCIKIIFVIAAFLFPTFLINQTESYNLVIWNVGQGSWLTWLEGPSCVHVDIGGELFPHDVLRLCGDRENIIYLTHLDWDHISFAKRFYQQAPSTCVVPNFQSQKGKAKVFLSRLPRCPPLKTLRVQSLYQPKRFINANQASTF